MSSFSGVVALAGEPESAVAATVEIEAGMLTLMAGGSQIGAWDLDEIEVEQTAGAFNLHADGEDLVLTTPDMTRFASAVGVVAAEPKREKRRRFGFRAGRGKATAAEPEPAPAAVAAAPPPPAEDPHADHFAEPLAAPALDVDTPGLAATPDLPAFLTEPDLPADPEPAFSTAPDMPAFPTEDEPSADSAAPFSPTPSTASPGEPDVPADDAPETTLEEPIDHLEATPDPYAAAHGGFATAADEPGEVSPPMTAAPNVARNVTEPAAVTPAELETEPAAVTPAELETEPAAVTPAELEFAPEPALRENTPETGISFAPAPAHDDEREATFDPPEPTSAAEPGFSFAAPQPTIDPAPQATPDAGPPPAFDFATPEPAAKDPSPAPPEPAFDFATPEPAAEDPSPAIPESALEALSVDPIAETATEPETEPAPVAAPEESSDFPDLTPIELWTDDSPSATNGAPTEDAGSAAATWRDPDPGTGRWPQPDPADEPAVESAHRSADETAVEPDSATTDSAPEPPPFTNPAPAAPQELTEVHPLDTEQLSPPAGASNYTDALSDAASRDVPAIAGIAAVATPDRYLTVEPDQPEESVVERPDHGADMASQEEISAWIADVNGDNGADEDRPDPVLPSRFETLRNRSAENYSDENVLSTPLTMAMFCTAIALVLGALLSWGIYELSDSFPVERLVSAIAAFAVATGAYLGWRQDRRVAGSIFAIGGGILALAAVYAYAREAEIGIGFLVATAGAVVAVVLGIVGATRFGHGPDPRIRE